ncbi:hypothetical protein ACQPW1_25540 [Nocardia sp. CA-128927]|uniref:hypothetical protein n=1 Tax=Nocardia sp. CA-128927 TaxID=3239975 RepID=UPI003D95B1D7
MRIERTVAAVVVSGALVLSAAAPAVAAPEAAPVAQDSGSATYAREFVFLVVCLLKGQFVGSTFPLC